MRRTNKKKFLRRLGETERVPRKSKKKQKSLQRKMEKSLRKYLSKTVVGKPFTNVTLTSIKDGIANITATYIPQIPISFIPITFTFSSPNITAQDKKDESVQSDVDLRDHGSR